MGYFRPLRVKFVPDTVACETVIFEPPGFVRVTACIWLVPMVTPLKLIVEGLNVSCPPPANAVEDRAKIAKEQAETKRFKRNAILRTKVPHNTTSKSRTRAARRGIEAAVSRMAHRSSRNTAISVCSESTIGARYPEGAANRECGRGNAWPYSRLLRPCH
jgi:hypothetical protein